MRPITDNEPFDTSVEPLAFVTDDARESKERAEARRVLRLRAERWGAARGFEVVDSGLRRVAESVQVAIEFSHSTAEMCTLRSNALRPERLHLRAHPRDSRDWFAVRFGSHFETADRAFDEHWCIETDNQAVAMQLLDARVRMALTNHPIWCKLTYTSGQIELHVDSGRERLTGAHLLAATEVVVAISRAVPHASASPYR